jgi:succinate dehydrogenase / fumarate reductase, cytochrome b subunit
MSDVNLKSHRPLSPHLQVYKPQITSVMSILHRITGVFLSLGSLLLAAWIFAAAYDEQMYLTLAGFFKSLIGTALLIAWTGAFYYHLCNGIRHMFWDAGKGFEIATVTRSGIAVLLVSSAMTAVTWLAVWKGEGL